MPVCFAAVELWKRKSFVYVLKREVYRYSILRQLRRDDAKAGSVNRHHVTEVDLLRDGVVRRCDNHRDLRHEAAVPYAVFTAKCRAICGECRALKCDADREFSEDGGKIGSEISGKAHTLPV